MAVAGKVIGYPGLKTITMSGMKALKGIQFCADTTISGECTIGIVDSDGTTTQTGLYIAAFKDRFVPCSPQTTPYQHPGGIKAAGSFQVMLQGFTGTASANTLVWYDAE